MSYRRWATGRIKWLLFAFPFVFTGCGNWGYMNSDDYSDQYKEQTRSFHPRFRIHHISGDSSRLYFKVNRDRLLFVREDRNKSFEAELELEFTFKKDLNSDTVLDSGSVTFSDIKPQKEKNSFVGNTAFQSGQAEKGILRVTLSDKNRNQQQKRILNVDRSKANAPQFFFVTEKNTDRPVFRNYFDQKKTLHVKTSQRKGPLLHIRYYNREFPLPPPPFANNRIERFEYKTDSTFTVPYEPKKGAVISLPEKGFIHMQVDTSNKEGLTLMRFNKGFPKVGTVKAMVGPIRYLTSKNEYEEFKNGKGSLKKKVDEFWLDCGGNKQRARELIRHYYSRVETANERFTSYLPGWKTDRGLIRIIYGEPNIVNKNETSETWIYGEENNLMSLSFTFDKVENPFTDNDYSLSRSQLYQSSWYRAVESWRNGRVYSN